MRSSAITRGFAPREEGCERGSAGGGEPSRGTSSGSSLLRLSGVVDGRGDREAARTVWFYRDCVRLAGGHVKHAHYFEHVRRMPGFAPRITFSGAPANESLARERRRLWPPGAGAVAEGWEPERGDVLFVAGVDWRYLAENGLEELPNPRINLVQGVRMPALERGGVHRQARDTAARHSLEADRARFHAVLGDVDGLWHDAQVVQAPKRPRSNRPEESEPEAYRPMLGFMIVGAQRCGTTALARFLSRHPGVGASSPFSGWTKGCGSLPSGSMRPTAGGRKHRVVSWLLRRSYLAEYARMRALSRSIPVLTEDEGPAPIS